MRIVIFCHSLLSDWNHGNAHFLRGVVTELATRGHDVRVYEPQDAWSLQNLLMEPGGAQAIEEVLRTYPLVRSERYTPQTLDLDQALEGADLVIVHEWNDHPLVEAIGKKRVRGHFKLLFHDTHHRSVTDPKSMSGYDLRHYDGVLAFGEVIRQLYLERGWSKQAWTWHEAADVRVFKPLPPVAEAARDDLVWVGNWGDDERTAELHEFLLTPVKALHLRATVHGVRYPENARAALLHAGIRYGGWLPNHRAPSAFAKAKLTVHVPRRPYASALPGIPTIRPFEALACGIPLVTAPWEDAEGLFTPGKDFLVARNGEQMQQHLRTLLNEPALRQSLAAHGLATIHARHTCAHRVDQLMEISRSLGVSQARFTPGRAHA